MNPSTFQFGPWLPDLANNGMPAAFGVTLGIVPCADCLNVLYSDSNYYCTPSPVAVAPSLGQQAIGAYTWYDNSTGQEIVFAGVAEGVSALEEGAWTSLPFVNVVTIPLAGWDGRGSWGTFVNVTGWAGTGTLGTITVTSTPDISASVDGGDAVVAPGSGPQQFTLSVTVRGGTATAWNWSVVSGASTISNPSIQNPTITVAINHATVIACTVTVSGQPIVATHGTYSVESSL